MGGLLYVGIVAMWAVVLIPMWLRRSEETDPDRSINRFHVAMATLRSDSGELYPADDIRTDQVTAQPQPTSRESADEDIETRATADRTATARDARRRRKAREQAAARRRRVLAWLTGILLIVTTLVLLGRVPRISLIVPVGLLAAFVVAARVSVTRAAASAPASPAARTTRTAGRRTTSAVSPALTVRAPEEALNVRRGSRALDPEPRPVTADGPRVLDRWEPVPTTLPTYVTAPAATRVPRMIDLTTPGSWSGQAMVEQAMRSDFGAELDETDRASAAAPAAAPRREPATTFAERFVADEVTEVDLGDDRGFWERASTG